MNDFVDFKRALPADLYAQAVAPPTCDFPQDTAKKGNEIALGDDWTLALGESCGPLTRLAASDFIKQMRRVFGIRIRQTNAARRPGISVSIKNVPHSGETYQRRVRKDGVELVGHDDEGGMRALFHLQRALLNRRGPFLKIGKELRSPKWPLRITSPLLHRPMDAPEDYLAYPENYLLNMARYGYNATYIFLNLPDYVSPKTHPYLSKPGWKKRLSTLKEAASHLGRFGIRLFFHANVHALPANHKLFRHVPETRGAQTFEKGMHCLCTSNPEILTFYQEAAKQLLSDVPELAGLILIVGGECFLHCYTRPIPNVSEGTNCPHCRNRKPQDVVSKMVNYIVRGARAAKRDARILVWPYGELSWGNLNAQARMLQKCDPAAEALVSFERESWITVEGKRSYVFDYSIRQIGPSPRFRLLRKDAKTQKRNMLAKTETSQCVEIFNVPRIPIMHRWAERYRRMRQEAIQGVHTAWRFYGFCAQRTDEIVDYFAWETDPNPQEFLKTLARRDFGERAAGKILAAWKSFSRAFDHFPYSSGMSGLSYFRGPFYIGPAHPFIFDINMTPSLPDTFFDVAGRGELSSDPDVLKKYYRATYFLDASWTLPFGPQRVRKSLQNLRRGWQKGIKALSDALSLTAATENANLQKELDLATCIGCMIATAENLVQFQVLRDEITTQSCTRTTLKRNSTRIRQVLSNEIENALLAMELAKRNPSLGFGTYGRAFDANMIHAKIEDTKKQRDEVIPEFRDHTAFHLFGRRKS